MNRPFSYKYEIAEFIRSNFKKFGGGGYDKIEIAPDMIEGAQVFRIPSLESLPEIKDYVQYYEFMKCPYDKFMIEMCLTDKTVSIFVDDLTLIGEGLVCLVFYKINYSGWGCVAGFTIYMDSEGYEVKVMEREAKDKLTDEEALRRFAWTVFELMVAVNTPNIKKIEVKAPKYINEKRKRKGKTLLAGYHYLDLLPKEIMDYEANGNGAQKRRHWRRGHIRRLTDKTIWIKPMLVGHLGFVGKTYRITT